jgi:hypothetical protein
MDKKRSTDLRQKSLPVHHNCNLSTWRGYFTADTVALSDAGVLELAERRQAMREISHGRWYLSSKQVKILPPGAWSLKDVTKEWKGQRKMLSSMQHPNYHIIAMAQLVIDRVLYGEGIQHRLPHTA